MSSLSRACVLLVTALVCLLITKISAHPGLTCGGQDFYVHASLLQVVKESLAG